MRHLADDIDPVLRPILTTWLIRSGALSALPDAPVVPDEPRRRLRLRRPRPATPSASPRLLPRGTGSRRAASCT